MHTFQEEGMHSVGGYSSGPRVLATGDKMDLKNFNVFRVDWMRMRTRAPPKTPSPSINPNTLFGK